MVCRRGDGEDVTDSIFADDFRTEPWWQHATPRPEEAPVPFPAETDVAIVGSGYTDLSCALTLARSGRDVAVLGSALTEIGLGRVQLISEPRHELDHWLRNHQGRFGNRGRRQVKQNRSPLHENR